MLWIDWLVALSVARLVGWLLARSLARLVGCNELGLLSLFVGWLVGWLQLVEIT